MTLKAYIVTEENEGHASVEFARHAMDRWERVRREVGR